MDILQAALIFSIIILSIFLSIIGLQVFFILRDLKKTLDKFSREINFDGQLQNNHQKNSGVNRSTPIKITRRPAQTSRRLFKKLR